MLLPVFSPKNVWKLPISDISGKVTALVPNGMTGDRRKLLLSESVGLLSSGTRANGPVKTGGEVSR